MKEKNIHRIFVWSLFIKGASSLLEAIGGILFLFTGSTAKLLSFLIQNELIEDPNDFIARHLQNFISRLPTYDNLYIAFYFLSHAVIKLFLIFCLLKKKLWAYPVAIIVFSLFILYQLYRLSFGYSLPMVFLTILDVFIIFLTWHEYKIVKKSVK